MNHAAKRALPDHPVHDLIADRWSPYIFERREVEREKLLSCLEAARWAASSFNEQPWSFIVAERTDEEEFNRMLSCLMEANQAWAANAGVLLLTVVSKSFSRNNKPNRVAQHDLGLAVGNLAAHHCFIASRSNVPPTERTTAAATYRVSPWPMVPATACRTSSASTSTVSIASSSRRTPRTLT